MAKAGRPRSKKPEDVRSERVIINVTPGTLKEIDGWAQKLRMPRSEFVEKLLVFGLEDEKYPMMIAESVLLPAMELYKSVMQKVSKRNHKTV